MELVNLDLKMVGGLEANMAKDADLLKATFRQGWWASTIAHRIQICGIGSRGVNSA